MKSSHKKAMIIGGALALCGPTLGVLGTVIGMMRSFDVIGKSGPADPEVLASEIGVTLLSTAGGIYIGLIGLVIFLIGLIAWLAGREPVKRSPLN